MKMNETIKKEMVNEFKFLNLDRYFDMNMVTEIFIKRADDNLLLRKGQLDSYDSCCCSRSNGIIFLLVKEQDDTIIDLAIEGQYKYGDSSLNYSTKGETIIESLLRMEVNNITHIVEKRFSYSDNGIDYYILTIYKVPMGYLEMKVIEENIKIKEYIQKEIEIAGELNPQICNIATNILLNIKSTSTIGSKIPTIETYKNYKLYCLTSIYNIVGRFETITDGKDFYTRWGKYIFYIDIDNIVKYKVMDV